MSKANEEWKELKPKIGQFVNTLDGLYKGAEDIAEATSKAEERGYKKGFENGIKTRCKGCNAQALWNNCNGYYSVIEKFLNLSLYKKSMVRDIIFALSEQEGGKNESRGSV